MLLKSLKLKNIRSYTKQEITFPENSTLLSGDIGSGKSTLLLAIEFALFGICKPDLTGETLLRKGTTSGTVELTFNLEGKEITIQRNLKKGKDRISQGAGYLIINNLRKDLTPIELKTEIINHLNYPEELITKNKNYIFRYTLYCPQEEMKQILQENPDNRLDILRKIFNLDKYKKIRENLFHYLKKIRIQTTILKTRIEPLDQKNTTLIELEKQQLIHQNNLDQLSPKIEKINTNISINKKQLLEIEQKNQTHLQIKNKIENNNNLLKEKQNLQITFLEKQKELNTKLNEIQISDSQEKITQDINILQKQKQEYITTESKLKTKINHCQEKVTILQQEISALSEQTKDQEQKEKTIHQLKQDLLEKEQIKIKKEKQEIELNEINQKITQLKILLSQAQEINKKISHLDECPTCLQDVPDNYKNQVLAKQKNLELQTQEKINQLTTELNQKQENRKRLTQQYESILQKENLLIKNQTEYENTKEKQTTLKLKKSQLQNLVIENNQLIQELEKLKPEEWEKISLSLDEKQKLLQKVIQKQEAQKNLNSIFNQIVENEEKIESLIREKEELKKQLLSYPELTNQIQEQKQILEKMLQEEKILLAEKTKLTTQNQTFFNQINELKKEIDLLNTHQNNLNKLKKINHWLDEYLVKLTYTIEKQVLIKIHHLFDSIFKEWFSILMEDENFSARLDDSFTPIIEQNGYEISFNNLSGGERTAASLSYRLALNKVINDVIYEIKTKNLLILDEPTDGFSSEQLDKVRDVLERLNLQQTLVVSHENKIESFVENVIRINKQEGVSVII